MAQPDISFNLQLRPLELLDSLAEELLKSREPRRWIAQAAIGAHTTACRWVHWAAAQADGDGLAAWHPLLHQLGGVLGCLPG